MSLPAQRMSVLNQHFFATLGARIANLRAAGADVIRLDEGAPDLPPAPFIIQTLSETAARPDVHSYQPQNGNKQLRRAWASMYTRLYGIELDPDQEVLPLLGAKEGIFHLLQALIDPGDVVLAPDPGYVTYTRGTQFAGGEMVYFPLLAERGWLPDLQAIPPKIAARAKILFLNYPNNPTGGSADLAFFEQAVDFARRYDILLCHDAAYSQVTFDGYQAPSPLQIPGASQVTIEFNTLSKSHNMAGWRVGAVVGQPAVLKALYTLKTNTDSGHFYPIMAAAVQAMTGDQTWLVERNEIYRQRCDAVLAGLEMVALEAFPPQASLYVWSKIPDGWNSFDFASALLEQAKVSITPGVVFGFAGEGYMRIALTAPQARIEQAMQRLVDFMKESEPR